MSGTEAPDSATHGNAGRRSRDRNRPAGQRACSRSWHSRPRRPANGHRPGQRPRRAVPGRDRRDPGPRGSRARAIRARSTRFILAATIGSIVMFGRNAVLFGSLTDPLALCVQLAVAVVSFYSLIITASREDLGVGSRIADRGRAAPWVGSTSKGRFRGRSAVRCSPPAARKGGSYREPRSSQDTFAFSRRHPGSTRRRYRGFAVPGTHSDGPAHRGPRALRAEQQTADSGRRRVSA